VEEMPSPAAGVSSSRYTGLPAAWIRAPRPSHTGMSITISSYSRNRLIRQTRRRTSSGRAFYNAMQPFSERGVYVNNLGEEGEDRIMAAYGLNYDRLAALKNKYDPTNLFHLNQNIKPIETSS
jgi:Berberine and berberine like